MLDPNHVSIYLSNYRIPGDTLLQPNVLGSSYGERGHEVQSATRQRELVGSQGDYPLLGV